MKRINVNDLNNIELKDDWSDLTGLKLMELRKVFKISRVRLANISDIKCHVIERIELLKQDITEEQRSKFRLVFKKLYFLDAEDAKK